MAAGWLRCGCRVVARDCTRLLRNCCAAAARLRCGCLAAALRNGVWWLLKCCVDANPIAARMLFDSCAMAA
eukprot:11170414-Lingulodinium_polyedra.AAC.1